MYGFNVITNGMAFYVGAIELNFLSFDSGGLIRKQFAVIYFDGRICFALSISMCAILVFFYIPPNVSINVDSMKQKINNIECI